MKKFYLNFKLLFISLFAMIATCAFAQKGAPHSLSVTTNYSSTTLTWEAPEAPIELKWHNNYAYNGNVGQQNDPQSYYTVYGGAKFDANDLTNYVGKTISSISYCEYYPVIAVTALIYENGKVVRSQVADLSNYEKASMRKITFSTPYVINPNVELMIAIKVDYGSNTSFAIIKDNRATEKGGFYSYDGKSWMKDTSAFLITANVDNTVTEAPIGYNVYCDGAKQNESPITTTTITINEQTNGEHTYYVAAVYDDEVINSASVKAVNKGVDQFFSPVSSITSSVDELEGTIAWTAPLVRTGNELGWTNKTYGLAIGGTATSNTKVWIKNDFSSADLLSFIDHKITAINMNFADVTCSAITLFVIKDNTIVHSEEVSADKLAEIKAGEWVKFELETPYEIESGHSYAYGLYCLHTSSTKPIAVDNATGLNKKGNYFSVSSPKTTFNSTSPTWKTLASGNIQGNWMMTADVAPIGEEVAVDNIAGYNVYCNGTKVLENTKDLEYVDNVADLGTYTYGVEAVGESGKVSTMTTIEVNYNLPAEYRAPIIDEVEFDSKTGNVDFNWNMFAELRHYDTPAYRAGFDEDLTLLYGTKFTADELKEYTGYKIRRIKFGIAEEIPSFKIQIYNGNGVLLSSEDINEGDIEPGALYSMPLTTPVDITGEDDIIIAYNATLPGGKAPIYFDAGPAVANGAVLSFTNGASWMNFGTFSSDYKDVNIVISALADKAIEPQTVNMKLEKCDNVISNIIDNKISIKVSDIDKEYGVAPNKVVKMKSAKKSAPIEAVSFKVYRNNEDVAEATATNFSETLPDYGIYKYTVAAVYSNGWESAASEGFMVNYEIPQLKKAPYELTGTVEDKNLSLSWKSNEEAPTLTYETGNKSYGVGTTSTASYSVIKFDTNDTEDPIYNHVSKFISHINFGLYSADVKTAKIVIFDNSNIAYEQDVDINTLVEYTNGTNVVALNKPYEIKAGKEIMIGYYLTYASGVKPMLCDEGPAVDGKGNLLSKTATTSSTWSTLKGMSADFDYNWRISATLMTANSKVLKSATLKDESSVTYNVYADKNIIASGLKSTNYVVANAQAAKYTVTSVTDGVESAHSNVVEVDLFSDAVTVETDNVAYYNASAQTVELGDVTSAVVYSVNGVAVKHVENSTSVDMSNLAGGAYLVVFGNGTKITIIK